MKSDEKEYTVTISKTVQERQYEPIQVTLTTTGICPAASLVAEQDAAYEQLKNKIQAIFTPTPDMLK
jgi:hypothetical protein